MKVAAVKIDITGQVYPLLDWRVDEKATLFKSKSNKGTRVKVLQKTLMLQFSFVVTLSIWFQWRKNR